jgi:large subunit ribosomal protein L10
MNRQQKEIVVAELLQQFARTQGTFLVNVQGVTVEQTELIRRRLREQRGSMRVVKNTLMTIAAEQVEEVRPLMPHFKEQLAVVFASEDACAVAKVLDTAAKENAKFALVAGLVERRLLDKGQVSALAELPPRPVLIARVCGGIKAPLSRNVSVLHQMISRLVRVVKQASEKGQ